MIKPLTCTVVFILALFTGCMRTGGGVDVQLDEYSIRLDPASSEPRSLTFRAHNIGSVAHQLQILKTDRRRLTVSKGVARTDARGVEKVGGVDLVASDDTETVELDLRPGSYLLICNIAGHYDNGMHARFRVGPRP